MKALFLFIISIFLFSVISISGFAQACPDSVAIPDTIYIGSVISATSSPGGGTWTSSNTSIATVGSNTGNVTGIASGTAMITYSLDTCFATKQIIVCPVPIAGNFSVCIGGTTTLTDATSGGTWSMSSLVASINSSTGVVTASNTYPGTATVTYTVGAMSTTTVITVNPNPTAIQGPTSECPGATITLADASAGGTWSGTGDATVSGTGSSGTLVAGAVGGTAMVTYTLTTGCVTTIANTIYANPLPIQGTFIVCMGSVTDLSDASTGLSWSSSNTAVAVASGPDITGQSVGTAIITFTSDSAGYCIATQIVTVSAQPAGITGNTRAVCPGATLSLTDGSGVWASSDTTIASVGSASGIVTGMAGGTVTITYSASGVSGCLATTTVTVNAAPAITGTATLCLGGVTTLADAVANGTWSSGSPGIATVDSTGVVAGVAGGSAIITYTTATGCTTTLTVTVNGVSMAINGNLSMCQGSVTTLSDASAGGTWSMSSLIASVAGSTGVVTASSGYTGTATISYTSGGCLATSTITVNIIPTPIQGATSECAGTTIILTDATAGGTWSGTGDATVSGTGSAGTLVAGTVGGDTATVTYTMPTGCTATINNIIYANPLPIQGAFNVCVGSVTDLTDASTGSSWASSNTSVAMASGPDITGEAAGTAMITFTGSAPGYCIVTQIVTVSPQPAGITGNTGAICPGATLSLEDGTGVWSSSNTAIATVGSISGIVTGMTGGTATITYSASEASGCVATTTVTVSTVPAITGTATLCAGGTTALTDALMGGTWSSGSPGIATVGSTGNVTGITAGTATISYTVTVSCGSASATAVVTVNPLPATGTITGPLNVCAGSIISVTDGSGGGMWSSGSTSIATVGSTGNVTGITAGTATISYTLTNGCGSASAAVVVTVNSVPSAGSISGTATVCVGATTNLTDGAGSGIWSSGSTGIATVGSTGKVTGVASGTAKISYLVTTGCGSTSAVQIVTVNTTTPGTITGPSSVILNSSVSLTDAVPGGVWSASNGNATVSGGGVSGVTAGTVTISYSVTGTCGTSVATFAMTVTNSLCYGSVTTLSAGTPGGTWNMASLSATVTTAGVLTAATGYPGTATVTYTLGSGHTYLVVTVYPNPTPVQCSALLCTGISYTLSDVTNGGQWSVSGDASVSGGGTLETLVAGAVAGSVAITYALPTGCYATISRTVYPTPQPITGNFNLCVGLVTYLSDASPASSWSSSNTSIAQCSGPDITGEGAGTATITFKTSAAGNCITTQAITVNAIPVVTAINGPATISHAGSPVSISDATAGGTWTSSNAGVIALSGSTGSPISATAVTTTGSSVITYAVTKAGCTTKVTKTFSAAASSHPDGDGNAILSAGTSVSLADDMTAGTWSSNDDGIATVDANGLATGIMPGSATITHETTGDDGTVIASRTMVVVTAIPVSVSLAPNPSKGTFAVKCTMGSTADEAVALEVTDLLGQVIYKNKVTAEGGKLNETIMLSNGLANGMYILNVQSGTGHTTVHFVIEQ